MKVLDTLFIPPLKAGATRGELRVVVSDDGAVREYNLVLVSDAWINEARRTDEIAWLDLSSPTLFLRDLSPEAVDAAIEWFVRALQSGVNFDRAVVRTEPPSLGSARKQKGADRTN